MRCAYTELNDLTYCLVTVRQLPRSGPLNVSFCERPHTIAGPAWFSADSSGDIVRCARQWTNAARSESRWLTRL